MSQWAARKARVVLSALFRIGWRLKRQAGSHRVLEREGWSDFVFAFHDREEIAVMFLWGLLGKLYALLAGWTPEPIFRAGAILLSATSLPVILYAGIAEVLRLKE